jgi:hypothetical protein
MADLFLPTTRRSQSFRRVDFSSRCEQSSRKLEYGRLGEALPPRSVVLSIVCFRERACITRLMAFTGLLLEPLVREPVGLLTQSILEKCNE